MQVIFPSSRINYLPAIEFPFPDVVRYAEFRSVVPPRDRKSVTAREIVSR